MNQVCRRLLRGVDFALFVIGMLFVALLALSLTSTAIQLRGWEFRVLSFAMAAGYAGWGIRVVVRAVQDRRR